MKRVDSYIWNQHKNASGKIFSGRSFTDTHLVTGSSKKCSFVQTNLSFYDIKQISGFLVQNLKSWNYRKYNIRVDILIEKGELLYASPADLR